ncbi:OmpH family outer membrane protein [Sinorhizobium meliloti]|uniref:DUF1515 domain-containing protein n=1 Tax=Rhizobium meliloti TaxID=382 RepID=UPI000FDB504B|nr:DUF1515 domain-containing protein [Sinorhizobium meliloti]RVQ21841.1 OmpH family outer membrane protein [Sinorhizobium meliloti]
MTTASYDRVIGRLETKLDMLVSAFEKSSDDSKEYRDRIYSELEQMRTEAAQSRREIADLKKQMDAAGPVISEINRWRERFLGMLMLIGAISAVLGGGMVLVWRWIGAKIGTP